MLTGEKARSSSSQESVKMSVTKKNVYPSNIFLSELFLRFLWVWFSWWQSSDFDEDITYADVPEDPVTMIFLLQVHVIFL